MPGKFGLSKDGAGKCRFRPADPDRHLDETCNETKPRVHRPTFRFS